MHKKLLIMRHAKAERDEARWKDFDRPLSERGSRDAPAMGNWLRKQNFRLDQLIASPAARTRETARGVAGQMEFSGAVEFPLSLYEGSSLAYGAQVALCPMATQTLLIVGHNPALEQFVELLCGEWVHLKTSAVVYLKYSGLAWSEIKAESFELIDAWSPSTISEV